VRRRNFIVIIKRLSLIERYVVLGSEIRDMKLQEDCLQRGWLS